MILLLLIPYDILFIFIYFWIFAYYVCCRIVGVNLIIKLKLNLQLDGFGLHIGFLSLIPVLYRYEVGRCGMEGDLDTWRAISLMCRCIILSLVMSILSIVIYVYWFRWFYAYGQMVGLNEFYIFKHVYLIFLF